MTTRSRATAPDAREDRVTAPPVSGRTSVPARAPRPSTVPPPRAEMPSVLHPRGRLDPPLPSHAPAHLRVTRGVKRLGHGLVIHQAFDAAPAMAFHFFLSLMPLLVFVGYVVGALAKSRGAEALLGPVLESLPDASQQVAKHELERLAGASALGPIAAVGFLWLASGGMHGLMNALETVIGAPRRPWWKKRALGVAWVLGALLALVVTSWSVVEWDDVVHADDEAADVSAKPASSVAVRAPPVSSASVASSTSRARTAATTKRAPVAFKRRTMTVLRSAGERVLALVLTLAGAIAGLAAFYLVSVSHPRRVKRRVLPGALLAIALWIVISWGFGLYARTLATYAVYYGSLTAVAVTLVWLWLTSLAILVGAELNAQLEGLRD